MDRISVTSSNLVSIGYDADTRVLEVEFTSGAVFLYYEVPADEHEAFMCSDSKGKFFNARIKKNYTFSRV